MILIPVFFKSVTKAEPRQSADVGREDDDKPAKPDPKAEADAAADDAPAPEKDEKKKGGDPAADLGYFADLHALLKEHRGKDGTGEFGTHNVKVGHHVAFKAGSFVGAGKVTAAGKDGLHVEDSGKREHRVHWHEVTGHFARESEKGDDV